MEKGLTVALSFVVLIAAALLIVTKVDFNRLGKEEVYTKITEDGIVDKQTTSNGQVYESYIYNQPAYKENGEETIVEFTATKNLRHDAYLKLYIKDGNVVTSYDEVTYDELPAKVQEKF